MQAFDKIADEWEEFRKMPSSTLEFFLNSVKSSEIVLDAGCGNGRNIPSVAKKCGEIYGVDSSVKLIEFARKRIELESCKNAAVLDGNIKTLPFKDGFFDKIICAAVLHHLDKNEQRMAVNEFFRVLKEGGALFATVWAKDKMHGKKQGHVPWKTKEGLEVQRQHYYFELGEFRELFEGRGFKVIDIFYETDGKKTPNKENAMNLCVFAIKKEIKQQVRMPSS